MVTPINRVTNKKANLSLKSRIIDLLRFQNSYAYIKHKSQKCSFNSLKDDISVRLGC